MTLTDLPEVVALSTREKLQLLDELWISIAQDLDDLEISEKEKKVLNERWSAFLKNPGSALTLEQFKEQMKVLRS